MRQRILAGGLMLALVLAGCTGPNGTINKSDTGLAVGAIAGGVIGNQFGKGKGNVAATALGAVIGGIVGSDIGRQLDAADRRAAAEAEYTALERGSSGVATPWRNPDSGHYGVVVPSQPYKLGGDRDCRDYSHTVYISGQPETLKGTACRNGDGTWTKVS
ncbi:MAG: RT0821/Lpp0805 family surface protein [Hyphomicrobiaceae bacterium]